MVAGGYREQLWEPRAVVYLLCTICRSPALFLLFTSTTVPNQTAWEDIIAEMASGSITWMVMQIQARWTVEKASFHREKAHRDEHSGQAIPRRRTIN